MEREQCILPNKCYKKAADGIYIEDGGDTALRKSVYAAVWNTL